MADTLWNINTKKELTQYIISTSRTPGLVQVVNTGLNGLVHIQNVGCVNFQVTVNFIIHKSKENDLYNAFENGNLIKVVDDDNEYRGYIISLKPDDKGYVQGYLKMSLILQQEVV